jgi:Rieske Fe-S protein
MGDAQLHRCSDATALPHRRAVLGGGIALAVAPLASPARADDADDPARSLHPQPGDRFAFMMGERPGEMIVPQDLQAGGPPVLAYPMDPVRKVSRDGNRLNQVLLIRLDPASLSDVEKAHAADGIVAFSAICTHQQCTVTGWKDDQRHFQCPCHQSEYDPAQNAKVVFGPAPRALPALPVRIANGALEVAGGFIGHVGALPGSS